MLFSLIILLKSSNPINYYIYYYITIGNQTYDFSSYGFECPNVCGRNYKHKRSLVSHLKVESGKNLSFLCPYCDQTSFHKANFDLKIFFEMF